MFATVVASYGDEGQLMQIIAAVPTFAQMRELVVLNAAPQSHRFSVR
jgi:hypothetical protein